jgi:hypothetical protein
MTNSSVPPMPTAAASAQATPGMTSSLSAEASSTARRSGPRPGTGAPCRETP